MFDEGDNRTLASMEFAEMFLSTKKPLHILGLGAWASKKESFWANFWASRGSTSEWALLFCCVITLCILHVKHMEDLGRRVFWVL